LLNVLSQLPKPSEQAKPQVLAAHAPIALGSAGQTTVVASVPVLLQVRREVVPTHARLFGVHASAAHTLSRHRWPEGQATSEVPEPSALQTRRCPVASSQVAEPGAHVAGWQRPARQVSPDAHAASTCALPRGLHTD
jgi:hypothetical protein